MAAGKGAVGWSNEQVVTSARSAGHASTMLVIGFRQGHTSGWMMDRFALYDSHMPDLCPPRMMAMLRSIDLARPRVFASIIMPVARTR